MFEGNPRQIGQVFEMQVVHSSGFTLYGECEAAGGEPLVANVFPALAAAL